MIPANTLLIANVLTLAIMFFEALSFLMILWFFYKGIIKIRDTLNIDTKEHRIKKILDKIQIEMENKKIK